MKGNGGRVDLGDRGGGVSLRGVEGGGPEVRMYYMREE